MHSPSISSGDAEKALSDAERGKVFRLLIALQVLVYLEAGAIPCLLHNMSQVFHMSAMQEGLLGGVVYASLSIACPLSGFLFVRFSSRFVLGISLVLNCAACFGFGMVPTSSPNLLILVRIGIGFTQAFLMVFAPVWVEAHSPPASRTVWMSCLQASVPMGVMLGYVCAMVSLQLQPVVGAHVEPWRLPFLFQAVVVLPVATRLLSTKALSSTLGSVAPLPDSPGYTPMPDSPVSPSHPPACQAADPTTSSVAPLPPPASARRPSFRGLGPRRATAPSLAVSGRRSSARTRTGTGSEAFDLLLHSFDVEAIPEPGTSAAAASRGDAAHGYPSARAAGAAAVSEAGTETDGGSIASGETRSTLSSHETMGRVRKNTLVNLARASALNTAFLFEARTPSRRHHHHHASRFRVGAPATSARRGGRPTETFAAGRQRSVSEHLARVSPTASAPVMAPTAPVVVLRGGPEGAAGGVIAQPGGGAGDDSAGAGTGAGAAGQATAGRAPAHARGRSTTGGDWVLRRPRDANQSLDSDLGVGGLLSTGPVGAPQGGDAVGGASGGVLDGDGDGGGASGGDGNSAFDRLGGSSPSRDAGASASSSAAGSSAPSPGSGAAPLFTVQAGSVKDGGETESPFTAADAFAGDADGDGDADGGRSVGSDSEEGEGALRCALLECADMAELVRIPEFSLLVLALSGLYYVVTGVQFWATDFLLSTVDASRALIMALFVATSATAPIAGVFFGGWAIDSIGGYSSSDAQRLRALRVISALGTGAAAAGVATTLVLRLSWIVACLWILLFLGGAVVPPSTGIFISAAPPAMRAYASSLSVILFNLIGYSAAPIFSGWVKGVTHSDLWGFRSVLAGGVIAVLFIYAATLSSARRVRTGWERDAGRALLSDKHGTPDWGSVQDHPAPGEGFRAIPSDTRPGAP